MNPSRLFILRPVATSLMMIGVLLIGIVAYRQLPVSALPEVDYPTIQVMTFYPGADPTVMASSVTAPLERQFGQVPGLSQMTSTSSLGASVITLQFNLDQNIDIAEQEVQASINSAGTYLPVDLPNPPIYSKVNPADSPILTLSVEFRYSALIQSRRPCGHATRAKNFPGYWRRAGFDQRRTEARSPGAGESDRIWLLMAWDLKTFEPHCLPPTLIRQKERWMARGNLLPSEPTINCLPARNISPSCCLSQWGPGPAGCRGAM